MDLDSVSVHEHAKGELYWPIRSTHLDLKLSCMHVQANMKMNTSDENFFDFVSEREDSKWQATDPLEKRLSL